MQIDKLNLIIFLSLFVLLFLTYKNVSHQLTTKSYILTTYMYIMFALLIITLINNSDVFKLSSNMKMVALCFLSLILLIILRIIPKKHQVLKHLVWLGLICSFGIMINPIYEIAKMQNVLYNVLFSVFVMFITTTFIAYKSPENYFNLLEPYLISGLIGLIIFRLTNIIFSDLSGKSFTNREWYISFATIIIFNLFIMYDTRKILNDGIKFEKICVNKDNLECADYPEKSLSVILDLLNLFANTTSISN